jgi:hypothetical protein
MIPASRAVSRGFPLGFLSSAFNTAALIATNALASASRRVTDFPETSTIFDFPDLS